MRPRLLDLFCGAGGAAEGYHRAGFDVVGVDIVAQPHYPYEFVRADAMTYPWRGFAAIHASPPCQAYSILRSINPRKDPPALIEPLRERLKESRKPYVIENVEGAPLVRPLVLCGTEFSLNVKMGDGVIRWLRRHRLFESSIMLTRAVGCRCAARQIAGVYGHGAKHSTVKGTPCSAEEAAAVLGVWWMTRDEMSQAIPPAYTEYVGRQLIRRCTRPGGTR
jgi:DNA (cytosine-5)-methyltransferase 1